jgi:hypothetical protein
VLATCLSLAEASAAGAEGETKAYLEEQVNVLGLMRAELEGRGQRLE